MKNDILRFYKFKIWITIQLVLHNNNKNSKNNRYNKSIINNTENGQPMLNKQHKIRILNNSWIQTRKFRANKTNSKCTHLQ